MAEENLGVARLELQIDVQQGLRKAQEELRNANLQVSAGVQASGAGGGVGGGITRDQVRRFNLRALTAQLSGIAEDIEQARDYRQGTVSLSWNTFLNQLEEAAADIQGIRTAKRFNINASWNRFLTQLEETAEDIQGIRTAKQLNINASWSRFLAQLEETAADIQGIRTAKRLNIKASWNTFLTQLEQTAADIQGIRTAKRLNIKASWGLFLDQLQDVRRELVESTELGRAAAAERRALKLRDRERYAQTGGRDSLAGVSPGAPNFVRFEADLARERAKGARAAQQAAKAESGLTKRRTTTGLRRRLSGAASSALVGGGFPLLFGQGLGASAGGLAGGALGGLAGGGFGFGASIVGTLIGAQVDQAVENLSLLGQALDDPIANFDALKDAALLSGKSTEQLVEQLIKAGANAEAEALIRADINARFGDIGDLTEFNAALDEVKSSFTELGVGLATALAPALTSAAQGLALFIDKLNIFGKVGTAAETIQAGQSFIANDPAKQREFDAIFRELGGRVASSGKFELDSIDEAVEATKRLLAAYGQLTPEQERQRNLAQENRNAEDELLRRRAAADAKAVESSAKRLEAAQFALRSAEETAGLEGPALAIAQQRLAIDKARAEQAQAIAAFERVRDTGATADDPDFVIARNNLDAAANNLATALVQGSERAAQTLEEAADKLQGAKVGIADLLTPESRRRLTDDLNAQINQVQIRAQQFLGVDKRAVDAAQREATRTGDISALNSLLQRLQTSLTAFDANDDTREQNNALLGNVNGSLQAVAEKNWAVNVTVNADGSYDVDGDALPRAIQ